MALCTLVGKVQKTLRISRGASLFLSITSLLLIITISIITIVPQFASEFQLLLNQIPSAAKELWEMVLRIFEKISVLIYGENTMTTNEINNLDVGFNLLPDSATLANGVTDSIKRLVNLASDLSIGIIQSIFILTVALMITLQPISYRELAILLVPSFYRRRARSILQKCGNALSNWMTGVIISSSCVALMAGIGLYILGVKLVIANALIAGLLNIIPNIGPTISTVFPVSVALLDAQWKVIAVILLYICIQNIESYLITPSIMHKQVRLLPALTITAQFVSTIIFGPLGLLLAIPVAVVTQVLTKEILINDILNKRNMG